jgi:hypothetical protein
VHTDDELAPVFKEYVSDGHDIHVDDELAPMEDE